MNSGLTPLYPQKDSGEPLQLKIKANSSTEN